MGRLPDRGDEGAQIAGTISRGLGKVCPETEILRKPRTHQFLIQNANLRSAYGGRIDCQYARPWPDALPCRHLIQCVNPQSKEVITIGGARSRNPVVIASQDSCLG